MYERMLDKGSVPAFEDMLKYCGTSGELWLSLDRYLKDVFSAQQLIRFPYGKKYGWGAKYSCKNKHICDIFAEDGAFSLFLRIDSSEIDRVFASLSARAREACDNKYACGNGGWLTYRMLPCDGIEDAKKLICAKMKKTV